VLAAAAPRFTIPAHADYAYLAGVMQYIRPADRPTMFDTLVQHLRPGAVLAMDMIGGEPSSFPARQINSVTVGHCGYTLSASADITGPGEQRLVLDYKTVLDGEPLDRQRVQRTRHFHSAAAVVGELAAAGFTVTGGSALEPVCAASGQAEPADGGTLTAILDPGQAAP
jgi:hypothetical protein